MRQVFGTYCLVFVFAGCCCGQTQQMSFINYSSRDGMPEKTVYNFAQDDLGFVWIVTINGLYRYDGTHFRKFTSNADTIDHQISNILQAICYDSSRNMLWLGSNTALQWLDLKTYRFHHADYRDPKILQMLRSEIHNFFIDRNGLLWIGTIGNGFYSYDHEHSVLKSYEEDLSNLPQNVSRSAWKIFDTPDGQLWIVTKHHILKMHPLTYALSVIPSEKQYEFTDGFYDTDRNCIWLSAGFDGLVQYDLVHGKFQNTRFSYKIDDNRYYHKVTKLLRKNSHQVWAAAGALGYIDLHQRKFVAIPRTEQDYSNRLENVTNLFTDGQGNLWYGSFSKGMAMCPWQNSQILAVKTTNIKRESLECVQLVSLDSSASFLLAANPLNGLLYYQSNTGAIEYIIHPEMTSSSTSVHKSHAGSIYTADREKLYKVDLAEHKLEPLDIKDQFGRPLLGNYDLLSDEDNHLYAGSSQAGIYMIDVTKNTAQYFSYHEIDPDIGTTDGMQFIYPHFLDAQGDIWFLASHGVYRKQRGTATFQQFDSMKAINTGASISKPYGITQDNKGHFWIATVSSGMFELVINASASTLTNYNKLNSGLPSDFCTNIRTDQTGMLWISTAEGLVRFDPVTKEVESVLGRQHGLLVDDGGYDMTIMPNNKLYVNGFGAVYVLDLDTYKYNTHVRAPIITALSIMDQELNQVPILEDTSIVLTYDQNFLKFDFTTLNLTNSNQNQYSYVLEGVDRDWITIPTNRQVSYSGLTSGKYTFSIKAANNDGRWSETTRHIHIQIKPPFWSSWWFLSGSAAMLFLLFFTWYRYRLQQVRREEELKSSFTLRISELEMKALRAQMNPHFIFNSLNSIQKYILQNDTYAASRYLTKFSRLIRLILDHSNQNSILLSSELEMLNLYVEMESLRFEDKFEYRFHVDEVLQTDHLEIPSMLIQPYIENAIWHGLLHKETAGTLKVHIYQNGGQHLVATIEDDGIGRAKAAELKSKQVLKKKSYGMQITEDRISIINKTQGINARAIIEDLYSAKREPCGTRVKLVIPYQILQPPAKV